MANELSSDDPKDTTTQPAASSVVETPFCGSLRSKKFFMFDSLATEAEQYLDASNHCWCRETQQVTGPDGGRVHPESCNPGRACYTSALERV